MSYQASTLSLTHRRTCRLILWITKSGPYKLLKLAILCLCVASQLTSFFNWSAYQDIAVMCMFVRACGCMCDSMDILQTDCFDLTSLPAFVNTWNLFFKLLSLYCVLWRYPALFLEKNYPEDTISTHYGHSTTHKMGLYVKGHRGNFLSYV